jgi:predicted membrane protein
MKMHVWPIFFGVFFILLGLNMILRSFFHFDFPVFKVAVGLLIIFIGIKVMFPEKYHNGLNAKSDGRTTMFAQQEPGGNSVPLEHSVVFGSAKIDLTKLDIKENVAVKVDTVFGSTAITIDPSKPLKISGSAVFGGIQTPDGNSTAFGNIEYQTDSFREGEPYILLRVNTVFGGTEINKEPLK